jgi:GntR family histidine utilization transcriptional repressor
LPAGARVFRVVLIHSDEAGPIQLEDRYVNPAVAPDFLEQDFSAITPSRYLLNEVPVSEAEHVIEAIMPDRDTRKLLAMGPDEPCLVLYRRTWSDNIVVTRSRFVHPASRYRMDGRFVPSSPFQSMES